MKKLVISIGDLHCRACETLNEQNIKKVAGVTDVKVSLTSQKAEIFYETEKPSLETIKKVIEKAGYQLIDEPTKDGASCLPSNKPNQKTNWQLIIPLLILAYIIVDKLKFGDFSNLLGGEFSLPVALLVGLVAGLSTCLALVGGLVFALAANYAKNHPQATKMEKFRPHIFFNIGRIGGFFILGGILGLVGTAFKISPFFNGVLTIIVGLVVLILGLKMLDIAPFLNRIDLALPKSWGNKIKANNPFLLGALTFFLPCGFTQAMQIYALNSGSLISGGLTMAFFAIGTTPGLISIGGIGSLLNPKKFRTFFKIAGAIIVLFAFFNLQNGWRLARIGSGEFNINPSNYLNNESEINNAASLDPEKIQIVNMVESNRGYSPDEFVVYKNRPVRWVIDAQAPYSCASALIVPSLKIKRQLEPGENIIEFTPTQSGVIPFSCSMGMYTGRFIVKD